MFLKKIEPIKTMQIEYKIPISNSVFPGGQDIDNLILHSVWLYH